MLRALYERGIVPDLFVGASAGTLNAAFVAGRPQTVDTIDELARLWCTVRREDVFPFGWHALVAGLAGNGDPPPLRLREHGQWHLKRIHEKLGVNSRAHAVAVARSQQLVRH